MKKSKDNEKKKAKNDEMKKLGFTRKILDDSKDLSLLLLELFQSKSSTIFMIMFRNVSLSRRKSTTPIWEGQRFSEEKWQFLLDV